MELFDFKTADILPSYLIFDPKTGKIERLTGQKQNENCLEITNDKYKEISNSSLFRYRVEFNPATTIYEVVSNNKNDDSEFLVDNLLHKVEETDNETDVILEKDYVNKKWILKFGETFSKQLTEKKVQLRFTKHFSITKKNDPHVLYRTLHFNLDNDKHELIFEDVDNNNDNYSIYTYKRFNSYGHKVLQD